jgi:glycerophosphoryl diester phosphodiesterase
MFKLLHSETGFVHVCGHRGNSMAAPENTLAALTATRDCGGTSAEIDVVLTSDGELVLMHDDFLDRTTNGKGPCSRASLADIRALDAGVWFGADFAGEPVPTLAEALDHATDIGLGLVVEIKEFQNLDRTYTRIAELAANTNLLDHAIFISFDHTVLKTLKDHVPAVRTEGILHARHVGLVDLARAARLDSVSVEHRMFRPEDGKALHDAGIAVRHHFQRPKSYDVYAAQGLDLMDGVVEWLASGVIDTISGDDVTWLADLARRAEKLAA